MSLLKPFDLSVYVITDTRLSRGRTNQEVILKAIAGGATCIQLREKDLSTREYFHMALALRELTLQHGVTFIINDRLDVALAVEADGVHLGEDDLPAAAARPIMPPEMILGVTARNVQQALQFQEAGASYLGVGSVFSTETKGNTGKPIGLQGLADIARRVKIPIVGIGGITAQRAGEVITAGASGVAVVSAVVSAPDLTGATREFAHAVSKARSQA
ncbi:MAG: thiamine phosphate synthase [Bacillota bacterium]|nr:thiamine phosphate synthase [Bacillota bacterium]